MPIPGLLELPMMASDFGSRNHGPRRGPGDLHGGSDDHRGLEPVTAILLPPQELEELERGAPEPEPEEGSPGTAISSKIGGL